VIAGRWQETHSAQVELLRHFCGQFFESEFVSRPGQLKLLFTGVLSVLASLSIPFLQAYYHKYLMLKQLNDTQPFRLAVMADSLFLIALTMVVIGLVTALLWQTLFPDKQDYLALAALPIRMSEIFRAKFISLLGFITLAALFMAIPLSIGLPAMMQPQRSTVHFPVFGPMGSHMLGIAVASVTGALFVFFVLVAVQGVLLNVLPLRVSARLSFLAQALLLVAFLAALPAAIAIPRFTYAVDLRLFSELAVWFPPLWFFGLEQSIAGNENPLAGDALKGLAAAAASAIAAYWWSYRRHRVRVLESPGADTRGARWSLEPKLPPRTLGVFSFIAKTLGRSPQHRLILTAFAGIAVAISANGLAGSVLAGSRVPLLSVLAAAQLALSLFTLAGLHYLFRLPVEQRANWIFRLYEPGHTVDLLSGVEWYMAYGGVAPVTLLCLVADVALLGFGRGTILALLAVPPSLILVEVLLFPTYKIPFTSLYLPARRIITETLIKYGVGVVLYISLLSTALSWCADRPERWLPAVPLMLLGYWRLRTMRLDTQGVGRIEFEELPDTVVQTLAIYRD
jgi:hypothetical protein